VKFFSTSRKHPVVPWFYPPKSMAWCQVIDKVGYDFNIYDVTEKEWLVWGKIDVSL
jgi:hypothetical protein